MWAEEWAKMALFVTKQFPTILVQTSEETVTAIPPGLPRSFAWFDPRSPCCRLVGRARHSTARIAHAHARLPGLHLALPPLHSMSKNKIVGSQWSSPPKLKGNLSKYRSTSKFGDLVHGAVCKWATTQDSTLYRPAVSSYFPAGSNLVLDTDCFLQCWRALSAVKTTRSTSNFFEKYWGLTSVLGLSDVPQLLDGSDQG